MMNNSQSKGKTGLYLLLILMILVLGGFSAYPYFQEFLQTQQTQTNGVNSQTPAAETVSLTSQEQEKLTQQAQGYEMFLQQEPDNQTALKGLLQIRLQQGDIKGALTPLEKLAQLNPQQIDYQILLAQTKQHLEDYEASARIYRNILTNDAGNIKALNGLVNLYLAQNLPEGAIALLQETLKTANSANAQKTKQIDLTSVQLILGQVYVQQARYTEAIAVYDQAIENNKTDFRPVLAKAFVFQRQGKNEEAKPLFTSAMSLAPAKYKDQIKQMALQPTTAKTQKLQNNNQNTPKTPIIPQP